MNASQDDGKSCRSECSQKGQRLLIAKSNIYLSHKQSYPVNRETKTQISKQTNNEMTVMDARCNGNAKFDCKQNDSKTFRINFDQRC